MKRHEKCQKRGVFLWKSKQLCDLVRADCGMICARQERVQRCPNTAPGTSLPWDESNGIKQSCIRQGLYQSIKNDFPSHPHTLFAEVRASACSKESWLLRIHPSDIPRPSLVLYRGLSCLTQGSSTFFLARHPNPSLDLVLNILIKRSSCFYGLMSAWNNFS